MDEKRLLGEIFAADLTERDGLSSIAGRMGETEEKLRRQLHSLKKRGLVEGSMHRMRLTAKGRRRIRVVFLGGSFEIIHPGHLYLLRQAKALGDALVVVLARSSTIRTRKGREPVTPEPDRLELMASLRAVDAAILGSEGSIYETVERVRPDVVALGYDQYHSEEDVKRESARRGIPVEVVRLEALNTDEKTSKILKEFI